MSDLTDLLRRAFPRHGTGQPFCAWCGHEREAWMALCRKCWKSICAAQREYVSLDIEERARWIIAHKP